jgi:preprotein translocase subunit YajC
MLNTILLQNQPSGGGSSFLILMVGMLVVFYFFIIRPQQKKQKDQKKFINEVKKGDSIITIGGIHGKVFEVGEDTFILEVEKGGKMKLEKSSISLEASKKIAK